MHHDCDMPLQGVGFLPVKAGSYIHTCTSLLPVVDPACRNMVSRLRPHLHGKVFASKHILTCTFMPSIYTKQRSKRILVKFFWKCIIFKLLHFLLHVNKVNTLSQLTITWPLDILIQLKHIMDSKLFTAIMSVLVVLVLLHQRNSFLLKLNIITYYLWKKKLSFVLGLPGSTRQQNWGTPVSSSIHSQATKIE